MDIRNTLGTAYAVAAKYASDAGNTVHHYGSRAIEKGRLGINHTVELIRNNPKSTVATAVAVVASAVLAVYFMLPTEASASNSFPETVSPKAQPAI